jgi:hypothetical protein
MRPIILFLCTSILFGQIPLKYHENITPTYDEAITWYKQLDKKYKKAKLIKYGKTDVGKRLHLFVISKDKDFDPNTYRAKGKCMVMINNAIHPGEPCGVDASLKIADDMLRKNKIPKNVIIGVIPMYSIGGVLNRNSTSRANQNGPEEYGFRGNARYLDLNRDFIKCDSKNAKSITKIFHEWNPDFFIDTHTTNGADYQSIMTMISPHPLGFAPSLQNFIEADLLPSLYNNMDKVGYPMVPYVSPVNNTPESGLGSGVSTARFSNGYAAIFNTFGFISEAHMFKTYEERVEATTAFLRIVIDYAKKNAKQIIALRKKANDELKTQEVFTLSWERDTTKFDMIPFDGYAAKYKKSNVTGFDRLYYDRNEKWSKDIPFYHYQKPVLQIKKPDYYVVPQAWREVIKRIKWNDIKYTVLPNDTVITGEMYFIGDVGNPDVPYNGHFVHSNIQVEKVTKTRQFYVGDILIPMNQVGNKYLVHILEPQGRDSFFRWNFFDSILDQREYFSPYIFEETAENMLAEDADLKKEFDELKTNNEEFANNPYKQLHWLYKRSPNFEADYRLYPVMRVVDQ